ncbi:hypothetical protein ACP4OV_018028 [Aristida adscensionis]
MESDTIYRPPHILLSKTATEAACMEMRTVISRRAVVLSVAVAIGALLAPPPVCTALASTAAAAANLAASRNCTTRCGDIRIPYPFGVEPGCYIADGFNLTCDRSHRLFLGDGTVPVRDISVPDGTVRINSSMDILPGYDATEEMDLSLSGAAPWEHGPYSLGWGRNKLLAVGCDAMVVLKGGHHNRTVSTCAAICNQREDETILYATSDGDCSGIGCCQARIFSATPPTDQFPRMLPAVLEWSINHTTCHGNASSPACRSSHSFCKNSTRHSLDQEGGHLCHCAQGYQGNPYIPKGCTDVNECDFPAKYPCYGVCNNTEGGYQCHCHPGFNGSAYIPNGCQDIDECAHPDLYPCYGICTNRLGTFDCQCKDGTYGNPFRKEGCIPVKSFSVLKIGLGVGGGSGILLGVLAAPFIVRRIKLQKVKKMKERFFKQNHGLLLEQLISQKSDIGGRMIITLRELEKATNNFDASHEIGGGGHGVVYKGLLNLQVVAIKKSKIVVQREIDDFINEVAILSLINHRNVVKLLGCCLETEVPLLVYEFISNGTLAHHLHVDGATSLSWDDRLRIALEIAKALAYLHSAASTQIIHRDIKSSNILLDDNLIAKVSDFGASRYIPIDQTGVTTAVQGTIGYLDPMYYYTGRLTDKSDVFSFGVLLIELLSRKKPFLFRSDDGEGLVSHFASLLTKGSLADILDPQIMEGKDSVHEVAELAAMCTKLNGEDRPTMRVVEMTLERLRATNRETQHNATPSRRNYARGPTTGHDMTFEGIAVEASRQYSMEEELLLSARYPR